MITISDKKLGVDTDQDGKVDEYRADIKSATDYYPFGMQMPGRYFAKAGGEYRFGFNSYEKENEWNGVDGGMLNFGARIHDPRLGRFLSTDPLEVTCPWYTPYQFAANSPIKFIDIDGKHAWVIETVYGTDGQITEIDAYWNPFKESIEGGYYSVHRYYDKDGNIANEVWGRKQFPVDMSLSPEQYLTGQEYKPTTAWVQSIGEFFKNFGEFTPGQDSEAYSLSKWGLSPDAFSKGNGEAYAEISLEIWGGAVVGGEMPIFDGSNLGGEIAPAKILLYKFTSKDGISSHYYVGKDGVYVIAQRIAASLEVGLSLEHKMTITGTGDDISEIMGKVSVNNVYATGSYDITNDDANMEIGTEKTFNAALILQIKAKAKVAVTTKSSNSRSEE